MYVNNDTQILLDNVSHAITNATLTLKALSEYDKWVQNGGYFVAYKGNFKQVAAINHYVLKNVDSVFYNSTRGYSEDMLKDDMLNSRNVNPDAEISDISSYIDKVIKQMIENF